MGACVAQRARISTAPRIFRGVVAGMSRADISGMPRTTSLSLFSLVAVLAGLTSTTGCSSQTDAGGQSDQAASEGQEEPTTDESATLKELLVDGHQQLRFTAVTHTGRSPYYASAVKTDESSYGCTIMSGVVGQAPVEVDNAKGDVLTITEASAKPAQYPTGKGLYDVSMMASSNANKYAYWIACTVKPDGKTTDANLVAKMASEINDANRGVVWVKP